LLAGQQVGPYALLDRLGAGGMGEVYLGRDTRLDRMVALKCLRASADGDQHSRALYEARAAAQINHVNVATIHDVIDEGAQAYIVMEYVSGETLAARLRRGRVSIDEALAIGRQLTAALSAAHAVGVVHRDLKPANVQITAAGIVKVLDFGIARAAAPLPLASAATQTDRPDSDTRPLRAGTPAYMAPEQMLGARSDHRADLYSLGVVMYEMVTGRRPYDQIDEIELLRTPETLARRATEIDKHVPSRLADLLEIALKCDPRHRFQSAGEFDAALEAVQLQRRRQWGRREWLAASAVGVGGLAAVAWRGWRDGFPPGAAATSIAVLPFVNLSGDTQHEYFVDGMTDGLINALGRIAALSVRARTSVMAFKGSKKRIDEIARELRVDVIVEGSALLTASGADIVRVAVTLVEPRSQAQMWSTTLERALRSGLAIYAELALAIASQIKVRVTNEEQQRLAANAQVDPNTFKLYLLGRYEWSGRTEPQLRVAMKYFRDAVERSPDFAPAYAGLADTYALLTGDFGAFPRDEGAAQAISHASRALAMDPTLAEAYTSLAFANFFLQWDFAAAGQQFEKALQLNPSYATAHQWYGNFLSDMGREAEGLSHMRRAQDLDPLSPIIHRDVAWPLFFDRQYQEAVAHLDTTLAAFPGYAPAERLRARALTQLGRHAEAIRSFEELKARGDGPRPRCELAWAYAMAGRPNEARAELAAAEKFATVVYQYDVALVHTALEQLDDAIAALERAFEKHDPTMVNLRHDPRFDALRTDPRYQALVARMRFPPL
jgi:eukaryotic-like serine/threonine-protein kinase